MKITQRRVWLCVMCENGLIVEMRIQEPYEGGGGSFAGDMFGFDASKYSDYSVEGGKLLEFKPDNNWENPEFEATKEKLGKILGKEQPPKPLPPAGGICDKCLQNPVISRLGRNLRFLNRD